MSASNALQGCTQAVCSADLRKLINFALSKLLNYRGIRGIAHFKIQSVHNKLFLIHICQIHFAIFEGVCF